MWWVLERKLVFSKIVGVSNFKDPCDRAVTRMATAAGERDIIFHYHLTPHISFGHCIGFMNYMNVRCLSICKRYDISW